MDVLSTASTAIRLADEYPPTDDDRPRHELAVLDKIALDRHPVAVYLARLAPSSRRTMRAALDAIGSLLSDDRCDAWSLDWPQLRYRHTTAVRALLADGRYAPSTANRHLAALRGVLKECWRLGYVSAEDFQRASDLEPVRGSRLPRGRALQPGEVRALFAACEDDDRKKTGHGGARRGHPGAAVRLGAAPRRSRRAGGRRLRSRGRHVKGKRQGQQGAPGASGRCQPGGPRGLVFCPRLGWPGALFVAINKGGRLI